MISLNYYALKSFVFVIMTFMFICIQPGWAVEPMLHATFNEESFEQTQWSHMAAGFGAYEPASVKNELIPMSEEHPRYTDGRGVRVTALSGQGSFITGPTIPTGERLVVLKVSVLAMDEGGTVAMGALNVPEGGSLEDMDGSLSYTYQAQSGDLMGDYHRIIAVYRAEKQAMIPFFQVAVPASEETTSVTVVFDNYEMYPLDESRVADSELRAIFDIGEPGVGTPTPPMPTPTVTPTITPTPTESEGDTLVGDTFQFSEAELDGDVAMPEVDFDQGRLFGVVSSDFVEGFQDIYLRHIDTEEAEIIGPYLVNETFENTSAEDPAMAIDEGRTRHLVWSDNRSLEKLYSIYLTQVDSEGEKLVDEDFEVNLLFEDTNAVDPAIAVNDHGDLVVCWKDDRNVLTDQFGRRFLWDGKKIATVGEVDYLINIPRENTNVYEIDVAMDEQGRILSVWSDDRVIVGDEKRKDIYARYYDMETELTNELALPDTIPEINVSQPDDYQDQAHEPKVAYSEGYYLVVWENESDKTLNESHIFAAVIQDGERIVDEFLIDDGEAENECSNPAVSAWGEGEFVVSWYDNRDGTVWARWYDAVEHAYTSNPIILHEMSEAPENVSVGAGDAIELFTVWNAAVNTSEKELFGFAGYWELANGSAKKDVVQASKVKNRTMNVELLPAAREAVRESEAVKERKQASRRSQKR